MIPLSLGVIIIGLACTAVFAGMAVAEMKRERFRCAGCGKTEYSMRELPLGDRDGHLFHNTSCWARFMEAGAPGCAGDEPEGMGSR